MAGVNSEEFKAERKVDPAAAFQSIQEREAKQRELEQHKWTLDEVQELDRRSRLDVAATREYEALLPYIEASNKRGDFLYPHQMDRKQAQEYAESKGARGEVWSGAELRVISNTPDLWREYGKDIRLAQDTGRLFGGREGANFAGEDQREGTPGHERFKRELNAKLERIDHYRQAQQLITAAHDYAEELQAAGMQPRSISRELKKRVEQITALDHRYYPVREIPGYRELEDAANGE